jgi:hypothetical protein
MDSIFTAASVQPGIYESELNSKLGKAWPAWQPETLWSEITRIYGAPPSSSAADKIGALKTLLTKPDLFFQDATVFENMILAACDLNVDPAAFQLAAPEELIVGIETWLPIAINHKTMQLFGPEIVEYIRVSCQNAGLLVYPETLRFAQPEYPEELSTFAAQIKPSSTYPTDETDVVAVQSYKLYQIDQSAKAMHAPIKAH